MVEEEKAEEVVPTAEDTSVPAEVDSSLDKYVKSDANPVSRILVTEQQFSELKKSLPRQEALISAREKTQAVEVNEGALVENGLLPADENPQEKIEKMMEQANQLYQSGDTAGAQALYEQISIENEKLKEQQAVK